MWNLSRFRLPMFQAGWDADWCTGYDMARTFSCDDVCIPCVCHGLRKHLWLLMHHAQDLATAVLSRQDGIVCRCRRVSPGLEQNESRSFLDTDSCTCCASFPLCPPPSIRVRIIYYSRVTGCH